MQRFRVLLLAENCNPDWPSLPVVGYKAAKALAEVSDVTLVTHIRNKPAIEKIAARFIEVVYLDNEFIARPMYRLSQILRGGTQVAWTTNIAMSFLPYLVFEWLAWRAFKSRLKSGDFDIVHRLTPMSPTLPSLMASLSPVPFVLGPLNGGLKWPAGFGNELRREREWMTYIRNIYRILPFSRSTFKRSAAILAAFPHTISDIPKFALSRTIDLPEVGFDPEMFQADGSHREGPVTFLFAGRLVPYKCADVAVEAFASSAQLRNCRLLIVGDGPEMATLRTIVDRYQAHDRIVFMGRKTQQEVGQIMRSAHVFAFPSIRELGAGVVVEAMACSMCCIVVDYGGPGGLIESSRGIKVPLTEKVKLIANFRAQMESLSEDRERIAILGAEARRYIHSEYSWSAKADKTVAVYRWVTGGANKKPSFIDNVEA